ncbi:LysR family transcriptional regulator [Clostridium sp. D2Q-11]|uniref:LysR family transcriptional regulator n=1 Tax=Anaeromonas frigoriresistens TaxID=2683708 RepID=A0A942V3S9_9FIRM|nr:LysR family transcriptional regulator [Anaeromonas frigoriresistens]MBS4539402.1 LysR family transcriptional regulator [Anaeromonas frigoriresistens]
MLDSRVESFLSVCKYKSYTKASEELFISQPAVTQHIQYLQKKYECKFFNYSNKELKLTKGGELLYKHFQNAKTNDNIIAQKLKEISKKSKRLKFAATLTIGEFTLSPILNDFINEFNKYDITMYVDNTKTALKMLNNGEVHFALVEGLFNKAEYESKLCKIADFILTAPITHPLASKEVVSLEDLKNETVIIREKGSGSREILERGLFDRNFTLENFKNTIEIGNVNAMKNMVKKGVGISFLYKDSVNEEIKNNQLAEIKVSDFIVKREFNFIHLKNELIKEEMDIFYSFFQKNIN